MTPKEPTGRFYTGPKSDHFDGERFFNPWNPRGKKGLKDFIKWRTQNDRARWPLYVVNEHKPDLTAQCARLKATYIGHATMLIQCDGLNLLTDPVFSPRVSPFRNVGPKRVRAPFVAPDKLPPIHAVFVSHNHYDHMDVVSLSWLARHSSPVFITPLGNSRHLRPVVGACHIQEMDWGDTYTLPGGHKLTLTPAQHWSRRTVHDTNRDLWGGLWLKTSLEETLYFSGDTGFDESLFRLIAEKNGNPDIALLPIGAYEPRWFMKYAHMNPDDAVHAHILLGAKKSMAFHFETFQLTNEGIDRPREDLRKALELAEIQGQDFIAPYPGDFASL